MAELIVKNFSGEDKMFLVDGVEYVFPNGESSLGFHELGMIDFVNPTNGLENIWFDKSHVTVSISKWNELHVEELGGPAQMFGAGALLALTFIIVAVLFRVMRSVLLEVHTDV